MSYLSTKWSSNKNQKSKKVSYASSFWADEWSNYDDDVFAESYYDDEKGEWSTKKLSTSESTTVEMLRLSAHRRAIANFVNILTNKNTKIIYCFIPTPFKMIDYIFFRHFYFGFRIIFLP